MTFRIILTGALLAALMVLNGCNNEQGRKIKLASLESASQNVNSAASSVLQVSPEQQRAIAILSFENKTRDASLDWLRRGLTDMLSTELSQSPYLNIIPMQRLNEIAGQNGKTEAELNEAAIAIEIARAAGADIVLTGRFYHLADTICIEVAILDVNSSQVLRRETVRGESLERIFAMVDTLSARVRANIRDNLEEIQSRRVNLAEMTTSVEAFRCYSLATENMEKLLWLDAEKYLEDAVKNDTTFASGYFRLAQLKFDFGKREEGEQALEKAKRYYDKLSETDKVYLELLETNKMGDGFRAITILEEAVLRLPTDAGLRAALARLYRNLGELDKSLEQFEIALELDPNSKLVYNDMGYLFAERGDFTSALNYLDKYQQLVPDEPNPYDSKGEIMMMAGRLDEAVPYYQAALDKLPEFFNSALYLATLYRESWDYKNTMAYIEHAKNTLSSLTANYEINYIEAVAFWRFGKIKEAEKAFLAILEGDPYFYYCILSAAEMYKSLGDTASALRLYNTSFKRFKEGIEREKENFTYLNNLPYFLMNADLPAGEVSSLLEKIAAFQKTPSQKAHYDFLTGLAYLRAGKTKEALARLQNSRDMQLELLARSGNRGWSWLWKFVFETLEAEDPGLPAKERFSGQLLAFSREQNKKNLEIIARFAHARFDEKYNERTLLSAEYRDAGAPLENIWRVSGPYSTKGVSGFRHAFPPESNSALSPGVESGQPQLSWQPATDGAADGYVNLKKIFGRSDWSAGYALVYIKSPEQRKAQLRLGGHDAVKLWFNDDLIMQRFYTKNGDAVLDREQVTVVLHPGYNKVLLKLTSDFMDWGFYFRVTDENGDGFPDITFHSPEEVNPSFALQQK